MKFLYHQIFFYKYGKTLYYFSHLQDIPKFGQYVTGTFNFMYAETTSIKIFIYYIFKNEPIVFL